MVKNPNTILFIYEGETEGEFYKIFFSKLPTRTIQINSSNLKGVYGLNDKVRSKILTYLRSDKFKECKNIHVYVAYDREGERSTPSMLDVKELEKEFIRPKGSRVVSVNEIIATQDLESWLFHDLEGIYKFLKVPKPKRNMKAYPNKDAINNSTLSTLFHRYDKHYQKGKRVEGFLKSLNMNSIYKKVPEIKEAIKSISALM